jgi:hypothetical protein
VRRRRKQEEKGRRQLLGKLQLEGAGQIRPKLLVRLLRSRLLRCSCINFAIHSPITGMQFTHRQLSDNGRISK